MDRPVAPPEPIAIGAAEIRTIIVGVLLATLLSALDQTIVATALPTIARELQDFGNLSWVVTSYLLTSTVVAPLYGKFSDVYGRKVMLKVAIGVFLLGSVACALAPTMLMLILARGLQGIGGGGILSVAQTIVGDVVPPRERGRYAAYFSAVYVTANIAGPTLGGLFAEHFHWSLIFLINLPLGALAWVLTARVFRLLPQHHRPRRIDYAGALFLMAGTVSLLLALSWGGTARPWGSPTILGLLALSAAASALFAWRLLSVDEPFIPLALVANPVIGCAVAAAGFAVGTLVGLSITMPLYYETVSHLGASLSGLALMPLLMGGVIGAAVAGRFATRSLGYKRVPLAGLAAGALAALLLAVEPRQGLGVLLPLLFVVGFGIGTQFPVLLVAVQNAVPPHQLGTATSLLNFFRSLGSALLAAAYGAIFLAAAGTEGSVGSIEAIVAGAAAAGRDMAPVFRGVFVAAAAGLGLATLFVALMKEVPLRAKPHGAA